MQGYEICQFCVKLGKSCCSKGQQYDCIYSIVVAHLQLFSLSTTRNYFSALRQLSAAYTFLWKQLKVRKYYICLVKLFLEGQKICAILLMVLMFTKYTYGKTIRRMVQIFVAFSEKLNFMYQLWANLERMNFDPSFSFFWLLISIG